MRRTRSMTSRLVCIPARPIALHRATLGRPSTCPFAQATHRSAYAVALPFPGVLGLSPFLIFDASPNEAVLPLLPSALPDVSSSRALEELPLLPAAPASRSESLLRAAPALAPTPEARALLPEPEACAGEPLGADEAPVCAAPVCEPARECAPREGDAPPSSAPEEDDGVEDDDAPATPEAPDDCVRSRRPNSELYMTPRGRGAASGASDVRAIYARAVECTEMC